MIIEELLKRAQIYNYIYKHLSHCSPIEKQDSNITISKHSHYQPKSTYHTSKKFTDNDKWVAEYDLSTRNPNWVYETLRRPNTSATSSSSSSDIANRKKSKFFADQNIPNHFKVY